MPGKRMSRSDAERAAAKLILPTRTSPGSTPYISSADTTKYLKKVLMLMWPNTKFSVRCDHTSARCEWWDGPTAEQVDPVANSVRGASFDGMQDLETSVTGNLAGYGAVRWGVKYVFTERRYSRAFIEAVAPMALEGYDIGPYEIEESKDFGCRVKRYDYPENMAPYNVCAHVERFAAKIESSGTGIPPKVAPATTRTVGEVEAQRARQATAEQSAENISREKETVQENTQETVQEPAPADPAPAPKVTPIKATVKIERDWTWVKFDVKPAAAVREALGKQGFRWSKNREAWYLRGRIEPKKLEEAMLLQETAGGEEPGTSEARSGKPAPTAEDLAVLRESRAAKWQKLGDALTAQIEHKFGPRQTNTPKRAREAEYQRKDGEKLLEEQQVCFGLASAWREDRVPAVLQMLSSRGQAIYLHRKKDRPESSYDLEMTTSLAKAGIHAHNWRVAHDAIVSLLPSNAAPRETPAEKKIRQMEYDLIGRKIPGFFPTPPAVVQMMLDRAKLDELPPNARILEPSAGIGSILVEAAKVLKSGKAGIDCIEQNWDLCQILNLKGFATIHNDFLSLTPEAKYDAVLMNPPFEKMADAEHVMHAYEFLKPGGVLVAIMSPGPFTGATTKAQTWRAFFQDWAKKGTQTALPDGSFATKDAFRTTGVSARIITLNKPTSTDSTETEE